MMDATATPKKLDLKKDAQLAIEWQDGRRCVYTIEYLRTMCPCAHCRTVRDGSDPHAVVKDTRKPLLTILPGDFSKKIVATDAQLVGKYALKIVFSDGHDTGIYSFEYLREICPPGAGGG